MRKCILSLEFVYLMIMTFAGTWFGIGVFYTMLYQLFMALFNGSTLMENVSEKHGCWLCVTELWRAVWRSAAAAGLIAPRPRSPPPSLHCRLAAS